MKQMEDKEHDTTKSLQKATHKHDRALTDLHTAQSDVQVSFGVLDLPLVSEMCHPPLDSETASPEIKAKRRYSESSRRRASQDETAP